MKTLYILPNNKISKIEGVYKEYYDNAKLKIEENFKKDKIFKMVK